MGQKPLGWDKAGAAANAGEAVEVPGVSKSEALRSPAFWVLALALLFVCMSGSAYMSYAPSWWQANGLDATAAANWNAIYLVISGAVLLVVGRGVRQGGAELLHRHRLRGVRRRHGLHGRAERPPPPR